MEHTINRLNELAIAVLGLLVMANMAQGAGYDTFLVNDYRSLFPLAGANVTLMDVGGWSMGGLTDPAGTLDLLSATTDAWNVTVTRSGYQPYAGAWSWSNDTKQVYLTPYSSEGIIYIKYVDLTLAGDHESCLFYASNGRLKECNHLNDTVTLHNNIGYVWRPVVGKMDLVSSLDILERNIGNYLPSLLGIVVILIIAALFIVIVRMGWKGGKK